MLYAGRRERDKGWDWLLGHSARPRSTARADVDLVTIGVGEVELPAGLAGRVIDLGFLSDDDRNDAFAAALAYVQPSRMESFSRTIMEAWLAGTPVLAIDGSQVVAWHCERSGGGSTFADGRRARPSCIARLTSAMWTAGLDLSEPGPPVRARKLRWPVVLDRMEADLAEWHPVTPGARVTAVDPGDRCWWSAATRLYRRPPLTASVARVRRGWAAGYRGHRRVAPFERRRPHRPGRWASWPVTG